MIGSPIGSQKILKLKCLKYLRDPQLQLDWKTVLCFQCFPFAFIPSSLHPLHLGHLRSEPAKPRSPKRGACHVWEDVWRWCLFQRGFWNIICCITNGFLIQESSVVKKVSPKTHSLLEDVHGKTLHPKDSNPSSPNVRLQLHDAAEGQLLGGWPTATLPGIGSLFWEVCLITSQYRFC